MGENRLFTKFLRSFFWFVLLPFCVILAGVTVYANRLQLKNDMAQNENLAAQVVNAIRPLAAVPTHYAAIVGSAADGRRFMEGLDTGIACRERMLRTGR